MLQISFSADTLPQGGALAILVAEGQDASPLFKSLDDATGGAITRAAKADEFTGKEGATTVVLAPGAGFDRVVLVGVGKAEAFTPKDAEKAGGLVATALAKAEKAAVAVGVLPHAAHVALGAVLGAYHFSLYHSTPTEDKAHRLASLSVLTAQPAQADSAWPALSAVARGVVLTRDLVTEPANVLNPVEFAERVSTLRSLGLDVEVLDQPAMEKLGFGALLGVAQGSDAEPRTVVMRWNGGEKDDAPLAFIGKGVTFDSGGISIKPAAGMEEMKWDMAGAATVTGLMAALAGRKAKVNAVGVIGLVENMVSGNAQRPGDVVRSASGQTIEVLNTDAEGRLVLADILWYARERFAPKLIVDLATLTGAIIISLGHEYAGLFSNNDALAAGLTQSGEATGDKLWRMPMGKDYDALLKSDIADMKNIGGRPGGSITAAQFLKRFVGETPWAHLDIAGTAWSSKARNGQPKGATGFGVRLLNDFVQTQHEKA
ncbi:leucyl/cytosol aminopeptidase [Acetobacter indonesiensis NRIC 0313]|uniref:Probable cytosol aminopeptidase n=1 Tax=Acetobacter indonesiensis TaxID=104101 RepID=A0A6N3T869_9PROT|nr:leucyl aminopeptidase [Acetobacter indonesiensis]GAN64400.1 leucyl aminopeptidase [Acetobacter indonesiensis]GBQ58532.1 leucyl/cytosol aminopeptidase [Acetobacter indonesiensis NRIC 0313]GEN04290.1 putative cytosol aminopeptidase [Acetobacter indonesiensis]